MLIRGFTIAILTVCCSGAALAYIVEGTKVQQPKLLSFATEKLKNQGTIEQNANGLTYVKLSEEYVAQLIKQINRPGFKIPNTAHICIIRETESKNIKQLHELGQTVHFKPLGFYTVVNHDVEYFMLAVDAPELSNIRLKYGLSKQLGNQAFSVVIGERQLSAENELES